MGPDAERVRPFPASSAPSSETAADPSAPAPTKKKSSGTASSGSVSGESANPDSDGEATAGAAGSGTGAPAGGSGGGSTIGEPSSGRIVEQATTLSEVTVADIAQRGAKTLDEAIEMVPGLYVRNGGDGVPRIDIRGLRTRNVTLLLDGVPLNSTFDGQVDPRSIPVEKIAEMRP